MRNRRIVSAYYDIKLDDYYTIYKRNDGKLSIFKLSEDDAGNYEWKILRAGGKGGGKLICEPTNCDREAEAVLRQYIRSEGLPATKYNYVYDFFPNPERIKLPNKKIKYNKGTKNGN